MGERAVVYQWHISEWHQRTEVSNSVSPRDIIVATSLLKPLSPQGLGKQPIPASPACANPHAGNRNAPNRRRIEPSRDPGPSIYLTAHTRDSHPTQPPHQAQARHITKRKQ